MAVARIPRGPFSIRSRIASRNSVLQSLMHHLLRVTPSSRPQPWVAYCIPSAIPFFSSGRVGLHASCCRNRGTGQRYCQWAELAVSRGSWTLRIAPAE